MNYPDNSKGGTTDSRVDSQRSFPQLPLHNTIDGSGSGAVAISSRSYPPSQQQQQQQQTDRYTPDELQDYYNDRASALLTSVSDEALVHFVDVPL